MMLNGWKRFLRKLLQVCIIASVSILLKEINSFLMPIDLLFGIGLVEAPSRCAV
jgi:hypothetical protein